MSEKRRGLGRGLGALIPAAPANRPAGDRPVDVFFPGKPDGDGGEDGRGGTATLVQAPPSETDDVAAAPGDDPAGNGTPAATAGVTVERRPGPGLGAGIGSILAPSNGGASAAPSVTPPAPTRTADGDGAGSAPSAPSGTGAHNGSAVTAAGAASVDNGTELLPVPGARFAEIPVTAIRPNPRQPRTVFDEEALAELVHSVKEVGVLQPVVVRQLPGTPDAYELIMGERRWRAVQEAGFETVPAIIRDTTDDNLLRDALLENLHRSQLNPLEEAAAYQQLLDDFGCTHEELAGRIGRSRPQISNTLRLLKLPPLVQRRVAAGILSAGHARALLGLEDSASMEALAQRIVSEGLSVRAVEEIVALGDGPTVKPQKKRPRPGGHHSELDDLASRLGDRLDTRVTVALGRSKGKLSIEFASVEDLNRIIGVLAPEVRGAFANDR